MIIRLVRDYAGPDATLGRLTAGALTLETLELPWRPIAGAACGEPDRSCVPAGTYELELHDSAKHPRAFALSDPTLGVYHMPDDAPAGAICRTACLIHASNYVSELEGCIGLGRARRLVGETWMITDSRDALDSFNAAVPWVDGHQLVISYAPGIAP